MHELSPAEWERYARHLRLQEVGPEGQQKLKAARVLMIGVGGLGSVTAAHLAAAGVGTLGIVEFDEVSVSNLHRQLLYRDFDVGKPKLWTAKRQLESLNPHVRIVSHEGPLDATNAAQIMESYDLVADGSDNFATRYLVNDACYFLKKPLVSASVSQFEGQLSTFVPGEGPCYRCVFPEGAGGGCAAEGVLGPAVGVMGSLQAMEVMKLILGIGRYTVGRLLIYDALTPGLSEWTIHRGPECPLCGNAPAIRRLETPELDDLDWDITLLELQAHSDRYTLIDVRERLLTNSLDGATHLPFSQLPQRLGSLDAQRNYVLVCDSGHLSAQAVRILRGAGLTAWNLRGGLAANRP